MRRKSLTLVASGADASGRASTTLGRGGANFRSSGVDASGRAKRWFTVLRFTLAVSGVDASGRANTTFGQGGASFRSSGVTASGRANTTFTANLHPTREPVKPAENRLKKSFLWLQKKKRADRVIRSARVLLGSVGWLHILEVGQVAGQRYIIGICWLGRCLGLGLRRLLWCLGLYHRHCTASGKGVAKCGVLTKLPKDGHQ